MWMVTSYFPSASSTICSNIVHMRSTFASVSACGRPIGLGAFFWASKRLTEDKLRPRAEAMSVRDIPCSKCIWRTMDFSAMLMRGVLLADSMVPVGRPEPAQDAPRPCKHLVNATQLWHPRQLMEIFSQAQTHGIVMT